MLYKLSRERKLKDFPVAEATIHCMQQDSGDLPGSNAKASSLMTGFHNKSALEADKEGKCSLASRYEFYESQQ